jgi:hypothetical protein
MKLHKALLLALYLLAFIPQLSLGQEFNSANRFRKSEGAVPNQYIVVFNESVPAARVAAFAAQLARAHGGTLGFTYENALRGFSVELNEAQAIALSRHPQVAFVESDILVEGAATQTAAPWTLDRLDQREPTLNNSYTYASDGAGVNAYVIDGGIRMTHQEFGGRAVFAYDNVGDGKNGVDCHGHGTHVAGTIGGATYGVAKGVKLHAVRVLNCLNQGTAARIIAGIDWMTANHVKPAVANLSFATGLGNDAIDLAVRNSISSGITYVVAAGNNIGDAGLRSPARVAEAITVAATDQNDNQASFSNFGAVVDVYAPGVDIVSAGSFDDVSTTIRSGTSFAAPLVTGLVARYLATRPGDQPEVVGQAIMNNATPGKVVNPGEGSPNLLAYAGITLSDDFNDNSRDAAKWNTIATPGSIIAEQNGRLEITATAAMPSYDGYISAHTIDLTDSRISVQAVAIGFGTYFTLRDPSGNSLLLGLSSDGHLLMRRSVGGVMTQEMAPYNAGQQRFWRFRHNRAADAVSWETSPDGVTWTTHSSMPVPFPITNLQVELIGQKSATTESAQTDIFDNLWHEPNPTPPIVMGDNFNDNLLDPRMWTPLYTDSPVTVAEQNQRIELTLSPNTAGYNGIVSASPFDFRDRILQVEVPQTASQAGWVETYFQLYLDDNNYYTISSSNNMFACDVWVNGVRDRAGFSWNGNPFWRFRHNADANTVSFETSANGTTWTTLKTVAAPFALNSMRARLISGAWGTGNAAPGTAIFDNFRIERFRPLSSLFPQSDNFDDNTRDAKKWNAPALPDFVILEQTGRLEITPGATSANYDGYTSATNLDLTDARASIEASTVQRIDGFGSYFVLRHSVGNDLLFGIRDSNLVMQQEVSGIVTAPTVPYDAVQHRFWRFRHNRANDTMNWETSPDGTTWTTQSTRPAQFPLTNLQALLIAGKQAATTPTATAFFDNLRIERNEDGLARTGDGSSDSGDTDASGGSGSSGVSYNIVTNFSPTQNPTGPWAYGYKPAGGAFSLFGSASAYFGAGTHTWAPSSQDCCPMVTKNSTGSTYTYVNAPSVVQPADLLNLHPGPSGERSVVRWTAPTAGTHTIAGRFQGLDTGGTTSDVLITHNGINIFNGNVNGYGTEAPFSLTRTVAAGDIVEFSVGYGENLNYGSDSTGLAATINSVNVAPQVNAAPLANAGLDATVNEGSTFSGTASFTDIDNTDTWTVIVDYGDGTGAQPVTPTQSKTIPLSHIYKDNAANPYTVTVTDAAGQCCKNSLSAIMPPSRSLKLCHQVSS